MNANDVNDKILWDAIKYRNDTEALEVLFRRYYARLSEFSRLIVQDKNEAAEIAADVFVNIWEKRGGFDISNIKSYLFMSAKNMSLNHLNNRKQRFVFEEIDDAKHELASDYQDPFQLLCEIENHAFFHNLIDQLPRKRRIIFKLNKDDGFKYKEIAEILNISVRTVEDQMMKALKSLRSAASGHGVSQK